MTNNSYYDKIIFFKKKEKFINYLLQRVVQIY